MRTGRGAEGGEERLVKFLSADGVEEGRKSNEEEKRRRSGERWWRERPRRGVAVGPRDGEAFNLSPGTARCLCDSVSEYRTPVTKG